ncbi:hypothetical protein ACFDR9_001891 [Janthinobacterium sp. CG_23.3]|uniref:DUF5610 domain-containing protein n=1 Tax=unclassified Janthinobacterium TaxID=2610881 RepID=UPI0003499539|nr:MULTISPECIES: DUF5610 domain-containing protein [unclassified Janthinobacterium]MEC5162907.1 hypothetical protein [Janthinobacterium sp. CG_S6]
MSNPLSVSGAGSAASAAATDKAKSADATPDMAPLEKARLQQNAAILQASVSVAIGSQNEPLSLLYKSAITSINEKLQTQYGPDALQGAVSQDNSAEGTAERIVSLSTGFFDAYKKQHPGEDEGKLLTKFMDTIRGGFESGFKEAKDILQGLKVLNGNIASNIDKTYALVQQGYAAFEAARKPAPADAAAPA